MAPEIEMDETGDAVWKALADGQKIGVGELASKLKVDQSRIMVVATEGQQRGFIEIEETAM
ncbi:MAG: hypothetical protein KDA36_05480 [Planctomycetaceae bacterium]|nr:hypothetical protein [Planctomycetaceae bacterium]